MSAIIMAHTDEHHWSALHSVFPRLDLTNTADTSFLSASPTVRTKHMRPVPHRSVLPSSILTMLGAMLGLQTQVRQREMDVVPSRYLRGPGDPEAGVQAKAEPSWSAFGLDFRYADAGVEVTTQQPPSPSSCARYQVLPKTQSFSFRPPAYSQETLSEPSNR